MRKLLVTIVQLLDGTPAVYGKRQSGQSVVELALITPILIILLAGLVEIGWFANNYLNLLDVSRVGARRAAVLQDQKSPLFWDNKHSYVPNALLAAFPNYQMPNNTANGTDDDRFLYRWMPIGFGGPSSNGAEPCDPTYTARVFYNEVLCTMIISMEPLELHPENGIDDMVVSGFSLQMVDASADPTWLGGYPLRPINGNVPQSVVAGRYPTNANECDVWINSSGTVILGGRETRDPFDFNFSGGRDLAPPAGTDDFTELEGYDAVAGTQATAEKQVGFSLFGNHKIDNTHCIGSDWTMRDVENLVNLARYDLSASDVTNPNAPLQKMSCMPSQGLVLVELHWEHEMLLKIPVLSPVYTAVGNQDGKMVINVWAAFPLPTVEPHILFPTPSGYVPKGGCDV